MKHIARYQIISFKYELGYWAGSCDMHPLARFLNEYGFKRFRITKHPQFGQVALLFDADIDEHFTYLYLTEGRFDSELLREWCWKNNIFCKPKANIHAKKSQ